MRIYKGNHSYPFARVVTLCLTCLFAMSVMGQGHGSHLMVGVVLLTRKVLKRHWPMSMR